MASVMDKLGKFECVTIPHPTKPNTFVRRTTNLGEGARFVGKCKCGAGLSHLAKELVTLPKEHGHMMLVGETVAHEYQNGACLVPCSCGRTMRIFEVRGRYSAKHVCSARCMSSKGPSCECSCAGRNHGASYG